MTYLSLCFAKLLQVLGHSRVIEHLDVIKAIETVYHIEERI